MAWTAGTWSDWSASSIAGGTPLIELLVIAEVSPMLTGKVGVVEAETTSLVDGVKSSWMTAVKLVAGAT